MSLLVIGIDPGLARTGIAGVLHSEHDKQFTGAVTITTKASMPFQDRINAIAREVGNELTDSRADLLIRIENLGRYIRKDGGGNAKTIIETAIAWGVIYEACRNVVVCGDINIELVPPRRSSRNKFADTRDKETRRIVDRMFPGNSISNQDEYDAAEIAGRPVPLAMLTA